MTTNLTPETVVGIAIRIEVDESETYIVFKIIDEGFRKQIREDWGTDVELKVVGKELIVK